MRLLLLFFMLLVSGCGESVETLRMVTVAAPRTAELALREVPSVRLRSMGLRYGLAVIKAGDAVERAGLRIGDVVYGVDQRRLGSLDDFYRLVSERRNGPLSLLVRRGGSDIYVPIDFGSGPPARETLLRT